MAEFKELLAIEWESNSVQTFKSNFPDVPVWQKNIAAVSTDEILSFCQIKRGELDVFDGSPPCQGFSTAGKRQVNDPRNNLFKEFVRLVDGLQPKVFLMENVSGMVKGKMRGRFIEIMTGLKSLNYNVKCQLMNTANYGVPQSRRRLIWIGVRKDFNVIPSFPQPTGKIITVQEALQNLIITEPREIPGITTIKKVLLKCREGETGAKYNNGKYFNCQRIARHKPCPTITKTACLFHWVENRYLTIQELKRLAGFPDDFQFLGTHKEQWARIGNAVMPPFMRALAEHIKKEILANT
jgi:DNA (cytosine-5)-methyltransferase 1